MRRPHILHLPHSCPAGDSAVKFEHTPLEVALAQVMKVLREIHETKGIQVPDPQQVPRAIALWQWQ
jgi:hypothetical protein